MVGHHIECKFICNGIPFFHFTDAFNIPCEKAMDALRIYQEFKNRIDEVFLKAHCKAKDNLYAKNPINVFDMKKLDDQLKERLEMALPPSRIIENMASVYYFDESENPYKFDQAYGKKKVEMWKAADKEGKITDTSGQVEPLDFFLSMPISKLIPSFDLSNIDFQSYLKIADMMDLIHLKEIFTNLSPVQRNNPLFSQLFSTTTLEKMNDLALQSTVS
jgi:hypothetical protein